MKRKVMLIFDGSNNFMRGFYAVPMMRTSKGFPTNAIKGVINIVTSCIARTNPTRIAFVMDRRAKTYRHSIFPAYKGTRVRDPDVTENAVPQRRPMYDLLRAMGIRVVHKSGHEADDIIGTIALKAVRKGYKVIIVSNDKDFGQLLEPDVEQWKYRTDLKDYVVITNENCEEHYGVPYNRVVDKLMMDGDKVDNIPGVEGIGPAALKKLIATHKRIEKADLSVLNKSQRANFEASRKQLKLTRVLATINCEVMPINLNNLRPTEPDTNMIHVICKALEARQIQSTVTKYVEWFKKNHN